MQFYTVGPGPIDQKVSNCLGPASALSTGLLCRRSMSLNGRKLPTDGLGDGGYSCGYSDVAVAEAGPAEMMTKMPIGPLLVNVQLEIRMIPPRRYRAGDCV